MADDADRDDLVARGKAAFSKGRYEEAVACLAPAAKADLTDAGALALLGASYSFLGRHAAAIAAFERALELKPDSAQTHYNLAVAFEQSGRADDALVHYREAARLDPDHAPSTRALERLGPAPAPSPQPAPMRRRAWSRRALLTVVGALVVVAAAGAGGGIGWRLSAGGRQRRAEERAQGCLRNLEALTRALLDYAHAQDDRLPAADAWISAVTGYLDAGSQAGSPLHCPSDPGSAPSYAMNPVLSEKRLDEIGSPDETILLYEVRKGRPVLRHRGTAFYAFVDGHTDRLSEAPDHLWRLKRPVGTGTVDPGQRPPPPEPEVEPPEEGAAPAGESDAREDRDPMSPGEGVPVTGDSSTEP